MRCCSAIYSPHCDRAPDRQPHLVCGDPDGQGGAAGPGCLFNVLQDPSELDDQATAQPALVASLRGRLAELQVVVVCSLLPLHVTA